MWWLNFVNRHVESSRHWIHVMVLGLCPFTLPPPSAIGPLHIPAVSSSWAPLFVSSCASSGSVSSPEKMDPPCKVVNWWELQTHLGRQQLLLIQHMQAQYNPGVLESWKPQVADETGRNSQPCVPSSVLLPRAQPCSSRLKACLLKFRLRRSFEYLTNFYDAMHRLRDADV